MAIAEELLTIVPNIDDEENRASPWFFYRHRARSGPDHFSGEQLETTSSPVSSETVNRTVFALLVAAVLLPITALLGRIGVDVHPDQYRVRLGPRHRLEPG